jgi:hypothetical protein
LIAESLALAGGEMVKEHLRVGGKGASVVEPHASLLKDAQGCLKVLFCLRVGLTACCATEDAGKQGQGLPLNDRHLAAARSLEDRLGLGMGTFGLPEQEVDFGQGHFPLGFDVGGNAWLGQGLPQGCVCPL